MRAKLADVAAHEMSRDLAFEVVDMILAMEGGIAAGGAGQDDVGAIAEGDLPIFEDEHHRDDRRGLGDLAKAGRQRLAVKEKAVAFRATLHRREVAMHISRAPERAHNPFDFHD